MWISIASIQNPLLHLESLITKFLWEYVPTDYNNHIYIRTYINHLASASKFCLYLSLRTRNISTSAASGKYVEQNERIVHACVWVCVCVWLGLQKSFHIYSISVHSCISVSLHGNYSTRIKVICLAKISFWIFFSMLEKCIVSVGGEAG